MRLIYNTLVLTLLAVLSLQVLVLRAEIDDTNEKAEKAMIIVALIENKQTPARKSPGYKRYTVPPQDIENPWMLEEPMPSEFPAPTDI
jgi:hypothetical protein